MTRLGFIGGGRMAEALIKGLLASEEFSPAEIRVAEIDPERRRHLEKSYQASTGADNQAVAADAEIVILAIKPQVLPAVIAGLKLREDQLLISIAAGVRLDFLEKNFPVVAVVRAMPNNPALVQAGITALSGGRYATRAHLDLATKIFRAVGEVVEVEEKLMDAVTGLSGSGPAYIYMIIEALAGAGEKLGIDRPVAEKLALHTVLGAAKTMLATGRSAAELREMVTSPGGTTVEGLKVLKKYKTSAALAAAVTAAAKKSKLLSRKLG